MLAMDYRGPYRVCATHKPDSGIQHPGDANAVPIGNALNKGLTLRTNQASVKRHLPRLIEHIQAGRIDPKQIITHRVPLEEVADAYHIFSSKLDNCIKTILIPPNADQVRRVAAGTLHQEAVSRWARRSDEDSAFA